ncbi:histidine phosphatase family protein, partial [Pseudomonas sp. SIMBA_065]
MTISPLRLAQRFKRYTYILPSLLLLGGAIGL